jgi:hypothetical protein
MRRFSLVSVVGVAAAIAIPSGASAATTIGQTFEPDVDCAPDYTQLQSASPGAQYAAPSAGVITRWSYQGPEFGLVPELKFKVARPAGTDMFTFVGESGLETPEAETLNSYSVRIPVLAGDVIGFYAQTQGGCFRNKDGYVRAFTPGDIVPPTTADFTACGDPNLCGSVENSQLDVSALLEPDCDQDGFGDETQDASLSAPPCPTQLTCKGQSLTGVGTDGPDEIVGTPNRDVIAALGGKDKVSGLAGKDLICGGKGKDTLRGGRNKDKLLGQGGKDKLVGGSGKDICKGGKKDDTAKKCEVEKSI